MKSFLTILMLVVANIFMTFAWYGHLKFGTGKLALPLIILISWGIAASRRMAGRSTCGSSR